MLTSYYFDNKMLPLIRHILPFLFYLIKNFIMFFVGQFGSKVELTKHEFTDLIALAKEGIASRRIISDLQERLNRVSNQLYSIRNGFDKMLDETRDFYQAMRIAPQRVKEVFTDIFQKAKEAREQKKLQRVIGGCKMTPYGG